MNPAATWICRAQGVALIGLAVVVAVLAVTSRTSLPVAFTVVEVVVALLAAVLFGVVGGHPRARTPILLLEIIAVGVAGELIKDSRVLIGLVVGVPALAATVLILLGARESGPASRAD